jgi:ribonuclease P protein component
MFERAWRLTRKRDLERVYKQGRTAATSHFFVRVLPNRSSHPRFTVVIGKKVMKKAVVRNRLKRLARQALQELMQQSVFAQRIGAVDCILTIHRMPEAPHQLAILKGEIERCFERLPSA